jgi:hypothetical protein
VVIINANPTAAISPDPAEVCEGVNLQLFGNPSAGSGSLDTHSWSGAGAAYLDNTAIENPTFNHDAAGTYSLTYTVNNSNSCTASDSVDVVVYANPTADAGPDVGFSEGVSVQIGGTPTATGGTSPYNYSWTPTAGLDDPTAPNPNALPASTTAYTVNITDAHGCTDSDIVIVTKYAPGIDIQKTVYAGHNSGTSCGTGGELVNGVSGDPVTYCFTVTNTGDTYLDTITITDDDLGINKGNMAPLSGSEPLAPLASISFYYETTITADLINTADASANPTDD